MRRFFLIFIFVIVVDGCIDPLEVAIPEVGFQLVVDGYITNEPGPYTVKLYRARPLETDLDRLVAEKFAKVTIKDSEGTSELLREVDEGVYQSSPNGIKGEVGRSYWIEIVTVTGKRYYSDPEEIRPVGEIDDISYEFASARSTDGFRVFVNARGVDRQDDWVRFRMVGTYEVETFPQLRTKRTEGGIVPDPYPCSGYVNQDGRLTRISECSCCSCWVNQYDDIPVVVDEQFNNNQFNNVEVGFVPINQQTFYRKFRVEVQQMSLTNSTFQFWRLIQSQKKGTTDLFQPPGAKVGTNIHPENSDDQPLGIFWAAGIYTKSIFIERKDIPYLIKPIDTLIAPCQFIPYSSNQKPLFW
ncbi:MAG: DUF4249 domain-containing protein [Bacteroidota bacterium]